MKSFKFLRSKQYNHHWELVFPGLSSEVYATIEFSLNWIREMVIDDSTPDLFIPIMLRIFRNRTGYTESEVVRALQQINHHLTENFEHFRSTIINRLDFPSIDTEAELCSLIADTVHGYVFMEPLYVN